MLLPYVVFTFLVTYQPNVSIDHQDMIRLITCNNTFERMRAIDLVSNHILGYQRQKVLPILHGIIYLNPPAYHAHDQYVDKTTEIGMNILSKSHSPRRIALSIISRWTSIQSANVYFDFIDYINGDKTESMSKEPYFMTYVSVKGLINIGKPGLRHCVNELVKPDDDTITEARGNGKTFLIVYAIGMILGYDDADKFLLDEIKRYSHVSKMQVDKLKRAHEILGLIKKSLD